MKILDYIESKKNQFIIKRKSEEYLIRYLLNSSHPEKIVKEIDFDTCYLPLEILKIKVDGYYNLFDYILKEVSKYARPKASDVNSPDIIIPWVLNKQGLYSLGDDNQNYLIKMPTGETVLEYICKNNEYFIFENIIDNIEIAKILYKNGYISNLNLCKPNLYKEELEPGITIGDVIKEKKLVPADNKIESGHVLLEMTKKDNMLLDKVDEKTTLLEFLLDNNIEFKLNLINPDKELSKIVLILFKRNRLDVVNIVTQEVLLTKITEKFDFMALCNNKKIYPRILLSMDNKEVILAYLFANQIDEIINHITKEALCMNASGNSNILEFLLIKVKKENYDTKKFLMSLLRRGLIGKEASLTLAKQGYYIAPNDYEMVTGINKRNELTNYIYEGNYNNPNPNYQELIEEFYETFNDGLSNKNILDLVIKSFNKQCISDEENAVRDLRIIIEYKKDTKNFRFLYNQNKGSCFSKEYISLDNENNIGDLNHELGHLIHEYINYGSTPANFRNLLGERKDLTLTHEEKMEIFKKINSEATELLIDDSEYTNLFTEYIINKYGGIEEYEKIIRTDFTSSLGTDQLLLECLKSGKYSRRVLDAVSDEYLGYQLDDETEKNQILDTYVKERLIYEFELFKKEMYRKVNSEFLCYENFIDAYLFGVLGDVGNYFKSLLEYENVEVKAPLCTHNSNYFCGDKQFTELFANYVELLKSDNGAMYIEKLKEKTSKELIEELDNLYHSISLERGKTTNNKNY